MARYLEMQNNPMSNNEPVQQGCAQNSQVVSANSTSTASSATTSQNLQKREKQRPESWNKIEQQIFFNALRQVIYINET